MTIRDWNRTEHGKWVFYLFIRPSIQGSGSLLAEERQCGSKEWMEVIEEWAQRVKERM